MTEVRELFETVIKNNYCIGCGACASVKDSPFEIKMNEYGNLVAFADEDELDNSNAKVLNICPFSEKSKNEDLLGKEYFPNNKVEDHMLGKYLSCYAGYVVDGEFRKQGGSGGMGKWLGYTLLEKDMIDYFIQVAPNMKKKVDDHLFEYKIFTNYNDIVAGSKSAYYPTTLFDVINFVKKNEGRYAITGVPCFIKTLRLIGIENSEFRERIKYTIGIICGGMKSANQASIIGMQMGVSPKDLTGIDFRRKFEDMPAYRKTYQVWSRKDKIERYEEESRLYGTDWGIGFFKPMACEFCDDVVGETADISLGDAWLPKYSSDPKGTNVVIVRNRELQKLLEEANEHKSISIEPLTSEEVVQSQAGGFRHRREALSVRIANKESQNKWYPPKRINKIDYKISKKRHKIYNLRETISQNSHIAALDAIQKKDFSLFKAKMDPFLIQYNNLNKPTFFDKLNRLLRDTVKRFFSFFDK
ncbi:Coenzyme F420 hydrogenase/dehydrogenase, beta subunit C-terminal domain [uncultured Sunxiuqinia sp.]|uniref:Coenzyme F420 hydrogenase/dehydrogenase, beta subunit C-terminal domain n=1 Tax=uncultured Sunxiuqinia sp. TaxID=1573825 RepID=UPI002AA77649|nr:Coenzyme F420 hydrogenase/dehydrogenase, beta subunit C-terminal domain [uncultured Sunxiuqinia sp.]